MNESDVPVTLGRAKRCSNFLEFTTMLLLFSSYVRGSTLVGRNSFGRMKSELRLRWQGKISPRVVRGKGIKCSHWSQSQRSGTEHRSALTVGLAHPLKDAETKSTLGHDCILVRKISNGQPNPGFRRCAESCQLMVNWRTYERSYSAPIAGNNHTPLSLRIKVGCGHVKITGFKIIRNGLTSVSTAKKFENTIPLQFSKVHSEK